jgi:hypothetical protein
MAYTTTTLVIDWIGTKYDSTNDLTTAEVTAFIAVADGIIDSRLAKTYGPFNATGSTPATPAIIGLISRHLTTSLCFSQVRPMAANEALESRIEYHANQGNGLLEMVATGEILIKPETQTDETLTFGTQAESWTLPTTQAFMASTSPLDSGDPPHIIKSSVEISSNSTPVSPLTAANAALLRNGEDFRVFWSEERNAWIFEALTGTVTDNITTLQVTYLWDYRKEKGDEVAWNGVCLTG